VFLAVPAVIRWPAQPQAAEDVSKGLRATKSLTLNWSVSGLKKRNLAATRSRLQTVLSP
jgi:hypothetical protein